MPDPHHKDANRVVLDRCDHAVITNAVLPEASEFRPRQGLAHDTGIGQRRDPLTQESENAAGRFGIEPIKPFAAARSNSIFHAIALQQVFQRNGLATLPHSFEPFFGNSPIL